MKRYFFNRLIQVIATLFLLITIIFLMFRFIPGDPLAMYVDVAMPPEIQKTMIQQFGLDKPVHIQYMIYIKNLLKGDFGRSFHYRRPVLTIISEKFFNTIILMGVGMGAAYIIGILLGAITAWRRGTRLETLFIVGALSMRSMPIFWAGILFIVIFGMLLGWLPLGGMRTPGYEAASVFEKFFSFDFLKHLVLPAATLAIYYLDAPLLIMRSSMLEVLNEEFIEMARAKGVNEIKIIFRHAMRNSMLPVLTLIPVMMSFVMGGQVMLETIFRWPGLGREIVFAVNYKDYPLAQALFFIMAAIIVVMNFIIDIVYSYFDPRVTYK